MLVFQSIVDVIQTALILLIAAATAYIAYEQHRMSKIKLNPTIYEKQLAVYREIIRMISLVVRDGDLSREDLLTFRSRTHEGSFLFDKALSDYIEDIYTRALKLHSTNQVLKGEQIPVGEERDKVTVENSKQLIWLADQVPIARKKFDRYLNVRDLII